MPEKAGLDTSRRLTRLGVSTGTPSSSCQRSGDASARPRGGAAVTRGARCLPWPIFAGEP
jgi:hypothetical protein